MEDVEKFEIKIKAFIVFVMLTFIAFIGFLFFGISRVEAKSFDSTLIRFFDVNGNQVARTDQNTLIYENYISYELINYNFGSTIGSGSEIVINLKPNLGFRFNPNYTNLTGLNVTYSAVLSNGTVQDVSSLCNDSAVLTKDLTNSNSYGYEYKLNISCQFTSTASYTGFGIRIVPITSNSYYLTKVWSSIDQADWTSTPSDADKIISNQNQNTNDIINNNNQNTSDIMNNQDENTDKVVDALEGEDLSADEKKPVDKTELNDYGDAEDALLDEDRLNAINDIDISIDSTTNDFIWDFITSAINTHTRIFGFVITILSIGIIKLALNR